MNGVDVSITLRNYRCFPDEEPAVFLLNDDFTAFVGPNNVGKSSLLRFFHELRPFWTTLLDPNNLNELLSYQREEGAVFTSASFLNVKDPEEPFCSLNQRDLVIEVAVRRTELTAAEDTRLLLRINRQNMCSGAIYYGPARVLAAVNSDYELTQIMSGGDSSDVDIEALVVVLRTFQGAVYIPAFRHAISAQGGTYYDLDIGTSFVQTWRSMKLGENRQAKMAAEALTDEVRSVFGFDTLEINPNAEATSLNITIDKRPYRLDEVGAGIGHFIICLAFVATRRPPLVLIDEPEANLHPSLQLALLRGLARRAPQGVAFASHSIGLVRATGARAYSLRQVSHGRTQLSHFVDPRSIAEQLGELSFSAYQEVGFRKVLLVEGSSEAPAVRELLRQYGKDHEVVVVSLGGADGIKANAHAQLAEVKRLTPEVSALVDSERTSEDAEMPADRAGFAASCEAVGVRCHILERRAFENYLPERAIQAVKGPKYRSLSHYEKLSDCQPAWGKSENWRIAMAMDTTDLDDTDLGTFLASL